MKNIFAPLLLVSTVIFSAHIYAEPTSTCKEVKFQKADQAEWALLFTWCNGSRFRAFTSAKRQVSMDARCGCFRPIC